MNEDQTIDLAKQLFIKEINSAWLNNELTCRGGDLSRLVRKCYDIAKKFSEEINAIVAYSADQSDHADEPITPLG